MQPFHLHTQMSTEHKSRHPACSQKVTKFSGLFEQYSESYNFSTQNTACKNELKKKKVQARMIQGLKKKRSCPVPPELFTVNFCYKFSKNNLIILTLGSELGYLYPQNLVDAPHHKESSLASHLDKVEWVWGTGC